LLPNHTPTRKTKCHSNQSVHVGKAGKVKTSFEHNIASLSEKKK